VSFVWDSAKATANRQKHGVDFADVVEVFQDPRALTVADDHPEEERFVTVGVDALGRVVTIVYTWRGSAIRIISARKATARERAQYEG
jgi:hypothetical protein